MSPTCQKKHKYIFCKKQNKDCTKCGRRQNNSKLKLHTRHQLKGPCTIPSQKKKRKKKTAYGLKDLSVAALNPYGSRQTQKAWSEALYIAFYTSAKSSPFPQILNSSFLSKSPNEWITNCISIEPSFKRVKREAVCYMGLKGFQKYFAK